MVDMQTGFDGMVAAGGGWGNIYKENYELCKIGR